ncbi:uncharacterized protein MYCFIDRAFT_175685 [Pseudocercospora fijiensis CIRAD86]|uniref:Uncharacterized protein n=1 Tax=Pseudocercospora fijiensis (strain CIRAD86) TaxID=383855 RepID=M2YWP1_PSEFD|nr:uncharacterized protein MYCFIDRAFT_175685 [Pseudocercospora fijiensis CIRAD86]EME82140.1 hypothetical protein MYCFIDRAFT_175685 [Pseudocercospora fijiensis CIRAD86]
MICGQPRKTCMAHTACSLLSLLSPHNPLSPNRYAGHYEKRILVNTNSPLPSTMPEAMANCRISTSLSYINVTIVYQRHYRISTLCSHLASKFEDEPQEPAPLHSGYIGCRKDNGDQQPMPRRPNTNASLRCVNCGPLYRKVWPAASASLNWLLERARALQAGRWNSDHIEPNLASTNANLKWRTQADGTHTVAAAGIQLRRVNDSGFCTGAQ